MKEEIWKLTALGRKRTGSIYASEANDAILKYLRESKTASLNELAIATGKSTTSVKAELRKYQRAGLVTKLSGGL